MIETIYSNSSFQFKHVNTKDVQDSFKNLNPRKSCSDIGLMPKLMKKIAEGIAPSVTSLYNKCIETSNWPAIWKRGEYTPVFKKGNKHQVENYRPITTLPIIDKVFESLLSKQITHYFDPTLSPRLTAYRKNHSCEMTLVRLIEDWKHAIDKKELVTILSTDMSKAFDSLCHNLVIKKLKAYGFTSQSLDLIRSFLNDKYSRVKLGTIRSEWSKMSRGCPQGSSFGTLLWNLFQNDMTSMAKDTNLFIYADDHQLNNFLLANTEKFQCLTINPRNIDSDKQTEALQIEDQITTNTLQIKLLGVEIDDKLNFTNHIRNVCIKASQKVGVLLRLQNLIPCIAKLIIYKSSILPHLTYCHLVWHNCRSERIQECTLRAVYNSHSELYENILVCTDLHSLLNRRLQDIAILMYKVKYGLALIIVDELFK